MLFLQKMRDPEHAQRIYKAVEASINDLVGPENIIVGFCVERNLEGKSLAQVADMKGKTAGIFFPKIFVKGFEDWSKRADALPEQSLVELKLTPKQFAALPVERQKKLITEDAAKHPERYRRECYRWYLACRNTENTWKHYAAPFPPRGGLPKRVQWLQIQVYAYWPPGKYLFDDVHMYKDLRQTAPLPEEKARTPNFGKTSDVIEKQNKEEAEKQKSKPDEKPDK